jgi:membrane protein required for colicin V production
MNMSDWNAFDWVLAGILLFSMAAGFRRGFVRTVFGLTGFVGGFLLASWKYGRVGEMLIDAGWIKSTTTAMVVAYLLIVVFVALGVELVARILQKSVRAVGLGFMDRVTGALFGFARGWMIGIALLMIPSTFAPQSRLVATSVLSPYFFAFAHDVSFLVPQYLPHLTLNDPPASGQIYAVAEVASSVLQ